MMLKDWLLLSSIVLILFSLAFLYQYLKAMRRWEKDYDKAVRHIN